MQPGRSKLFIGYAAMVGAAALGFFCVREVGESLPAPAAEAARAVPAALGERVNALLHVLVALAAIIVTARLIGRFFARLGQPPVIGEVVGGILLGPSLLGRVAPDAYAALLPATVAPFLGVHAQLGIILYMFLVGLELDPAVIRRSGHATLAISHASIIAPFILGSALALALYPLLATSQTSFTVFALFMGVSMSVTAFPVLARILADRGIARTRMGMVAIACAAVDDATAWCLLALVVSIAQARASDAAVTSALAVAFVLVMAFVAAPAIRRVAAGAERDRELSRGTLAVVLVGMLVAAATTEWIGIHGLFGAFAFGVAVPHASRIAEGVSARLDDVVAVLFLPAFFAFTGMRTELGLISGLQNWLICGAIVLVACAGKFGGTLAAARLVGLGWRDSSALGVLMNTRGLVELIVLNIGLDLRLISPRLFTMLVIMALATTFMTTPILQLLLRRHPWELTAARRVSI